MALQVNNPYTTEYGIELATSYWRWVGLAIDVTATQARAVLHGYVSETAFNSGRHPVGQKAYVLQGVDFGTMVLMAPDGPTLSDALSNAIYDHVVANDEFFTGATEV